MKRVSSIILRYLILVLVAIPNLYIFYFIFTPLTTYPVYFLLNLFYDASMAGNLINIGCSTIALIGACIGGSAYYLLLILNLSTPKIKFKRRMRILGFAFASFLLINILRIFLLSLMFLKNSTWFDITHELFWYFGSIIFVVAIWFIEVKYYKIKEIPFYSDLKFLSSKLK